VVHKWAGRKLPRTITLENVHQILNWSPLVAKRDKATKRVVKLDGTIAAPGERVPVNEQWLVPNTKKKGRNWQHFVQGLRDMGYAVQW
jgi:DNA (cytosine-5)-methyltransferase 1